MNNRDLGSFNKVGNLLVHSYERYLPTAFDESMTLLQKVNKIIDYCNQLGIITNDLIDNWNEIYRWILNEGLTDAVIKKLNEMIENGLLAELINNQIFGELNKSVSVVPTAQSVWRSPDVSGTRLNENGTPSSYDVNQNLAVYFDKLVDNKYVTKESVGLSQDGNYPIYQYTFTPKNYERTIIITSMVHGNEYTGFYSLAQFMNLVVNDWHKYPQLAYLRKNIRMVVIPIVNPWGFERGIRHNSRQVDLNRNWDYEWSRYSHTNPGQVYYKGVSPFSENEVKVLKGVFDKYENATAYVDLHTIKSVEGEYIMFHPRLANQENNNMSQLIRAMRKEGERVVWGSSILPSNTNYVANEYGINSYLPEFYNGILGEERSPVEMKRCLNWFGNVIIEASKIPLKARAEILKYPTVRVYDYDDRRGGSLAVLSTTNDAWTNFTFTRQEFTVQTNGIIELSGTVTIQADHDCEVGVRPIIAQNFAPYFSLTSSSNRSNFELTFTMKQGEVRTIPVSAVMYAQVTNITTANRSKEVSCRLQIKKSNGRIVIRSYKPIIKFTPVSSASSFTLYESTNQGNLQENTFTQTYPNFTYNDGEYGDETSGGD